MVFAAFARDKHECGYYSGSERLTFDIRDDPDMHEPTLTLVRTPLAQPISDLITFAHMGDTDVLGFLASNFLIFGVPYKVMVRRLPCAMCMLCVRV